MKRTKGIILILLLGFLITFFYLPQLFWSYISTYKFSIKESENPELFIDRNLNPTYFHFHKEAEGFSPFTKIMLPEQDIITVEHLVRVIKYDMELIPEIKNNNYFFSAVEVPFKDVTKIQMSHFYDGKKLEEVGTFIYTYKKDKNGNKLNEIFNVKKITQNPNQISENDEFIYVKIYKFPRIQSNIIFQIFVPQKYWFPKEMTQKIEMEYKFKGKEEKVTYSFNLYWQIRTSLFERFITIT